MTHETIALTFDSSFFLGSIAVILEHFLGSISGTLEATSLDGNMARLLLDLLFSKEARFGLSFL